MSDHPECDKMLAVADESHTIGDFLDWLSEQHIHLARFENDRECRYDNESLYRSATYKCVDGELIGFGDFKSIGPCPQCKGTGKVPRIEAIMVAIPTDWNRLLAKYFGIDLDKVERERRDILASLQPVPAVSVSLPEDRKDTK